MPETKKEVISDFLYAEREELRFEPSK